MDVKSYSKVSIKPYLEKGTPNMGLEKYDQALFDSTEHSYEIAAVVEGNVVRYLTGLNPFAPEVNRLPDEEREAKQLEIKKIVIELEKRIAGNIIDPEDPAWWNKVQKLRPDNVPFWSSEDMELKLSNHGLDLDLHNSTSDLIKYFAVKSGGVPEIAVNMDDAKSRSVRPKFFLDELEETATLQTEYWKLRDEAGALLKDLYTTKLNKFIYVCKVVDANSAQYKKSTLPDVMYLNMSKFLEGQGTESQKKQAIKTFIEAAKLDMETLKLRSVIKDATFYKFISIKGDGMIYEMQSGTAMGKNPAQVLEFLKNPLNEEVAKRLLTKLEEYWKR